MTGTVATPAATAARTAAPPPFDVQAVRRQFPVLAQRPYGKRLAYLDSGATAQKPQAVIDAVSRFYSVDNSNVHRGVYDLAERATAAFEGARRGGDRGGHAASRMRSPSGSRAATSRPSRSRSAGTATRSTISRAKA